MYSDFTLKVSYNVGILKQHEITMKYFENKIISNKVFKKSMMTEEEFNRLGKQGWELAQINSDESGISKAYFKRPI